MNQNSAIRMQNPQKQLSTQDLQLSNYQQQLNQSAAKQNLLASVVGYLLKSETMVVRAISNYRSLISFLIAYNNSGQQEQVQQIRQVNQEISADAQQFIQYFGKLLGHVGQLPEVMNQFGPIVTNLQQEVDTLSQDCGRSSFVHSPLLLEFSLKRKAEVVDLVEELTKVNLSQQSALYQEQILQQNAQLQQLQANLALIQDQNFELQRQVAQQTAESELFRSQKLSVSGVSESQNQGNLPQRLKAAEEKVARLDGENELLRQNIQDLRRNLAQTAGEERASQGVLRVLKESMEGDKRIIDELIAEKQKLLEKLRGFELRGVDAAHLEAIQLSLKQVVQICGERAITQQFAEGGEAKAVQRNIGLISQVVYEMAAKLRAGERLAQEQREAVLLQQQSSANLQQQLEQLEKAKKDELLLKDSRQSELINQAKNDVQIVKQKEIEDLLLKINGLEENIRGLNNQIDVLRSQLSQSQNNQQSVALKQNVAATLNRIRQEVLAVYEAAGVRPKEHSELEFSGLVERVRLLKVTENDHDQVLAKLRQLEIYQSHIEVQVREVFQKFI